MALRREDLKAEASGYLIISPLSPLPSSSIKHGPGRHWRGGEPWARGAAAGGAGHQEAPAVPAAVGDGVSDARARVRRRVSGGEWSERAGLCVCVCA